MDAGCSGNCAATMGPSVGAWIGVIAWSKLIACIQACQVNYGRTSSHATSPQSLIMSLTLHSCHDTVSKQHTPALMDAYAMHQKPSPRKRHFCLKLHILQTASCPPQPGHSQSISSTKHFLPGLGGFITLTSTLRMRRASFSCWTTSKEREQESRPQRSL